MSSHPNFHSFPKKRGSGRTTRIVDQAIYYANAHRGETVPFVVSTYQQGDLVKRHIAKRYEELGIFFINNIVVLPLTDLHKWDDALRGRSSIGDFFWDHYATECLVNQWEIEKERVKELEAKVAELEKYAPSLTDVETSLVRGLIYRAIQGGSPVFEVLMRADTKLAVAAGQTSLKDVVCP